MFDTGNCNYNLCTEGFIQHTHTHGHRRSQEQIKLIQKIAARERVKGEEKPYKGKNESKINKLSKCGKI